MQSGYVFWRILPDSGGGLAVCVCVCVCVCVWGHVWGGGGCYGVWFVVKTRAAGLSRVQVGPAGPPRVTLPLSVSSCREPWQQGPGAEPRPRSSSPEPTTHSGRRCGGGTRLSVSPHCPPPPPPPSPSSCSVFGPSPERPNSRSLSLGSLIVFVPVSRQIEFGLLQKKMPQLIWSYCPKEWPGLKG